jgi:hypothetical protein
MQHTLEIGTKSTEFHHFLASNCGTVWTITKSARDFALLPLLILPASKRRGAGRKNTAPRRIGAPSLTAQDTLLPSTAAIRAATAKDGLSQSTRIDNAGAVRERGPFSAFAYVKIFVPKIRH